MDRDKPDLSLQCGGILPSDAAMEQAKETKDKVEAEARGEEGHPFLDAAMDEGKPKPESKEQCFLSDAAMKQLEGVKDEVKAELRSGYIPSLSGDGRSAGHDTKDRSKERR